MDPFEKAERGVLVSLFINWHRPGQNLLDNDLLDARFGIKISDKWFRAIVMALQDSALVDVFEDKDSIDVKLRDSAFKLAHSKVLQLLGATRFEVDWEKREIHSDVGHVEGLPLPVEWRWYNHGPPRPAGVVVHTVEVDWQAVGAIIAGLTLIVAIIALFVRE